MWFVACPHYHIYAILYISNSNKMYNNKIHLPRVATHRPRSTRHAAATGPAERCVVCMREWSPLLLQLQVQRYLNKIKCISAVGFI